MSYNNRVSKNVYFCGKCKKAITSGDCICPRDYSMLDPVSIKHSDTSQSKIKKHPTEHIRTDPSDFLKEVYDKFASSYRNPGDAYFEISDFTAISIEGSYNKGEGVRAKVYARKNYQPTRKSLRELARQVISLMGFGILIDEDNGNGFYRDAFDIASKIRALNFVILSKTRIDNHTLNDEGYIAHTFIRNLKKDLNYYDDYLNDFG